MNRWDLQKTYELVRDVFGRDQVQLVRDCARSVVDRQNFSSYHFTEAQRLTKDFERRHLSRLQTILEMHMADGQRRRIAFERYIVKAGAHALGAIQSLHSIPDILSHVVYFGTGQQLGSAPLRDRDISVSTVSKRMEGQLLLGRISVMLASTTAGSGWKHLDAVCNQSKHRSVVRASLNEDWSGTRSTFRELHVASFGRQGHHFEAKSLRDLLEPEYDRLSRLTIDIGNELCVWLRWTRDGSTGD